MCASRLLDGALSLGSTPAANAFVKPEDLGKPEIFFPLELTLCRSCGFVQLRHVVSPEFLFRDYPYVSSTSSAFVAHFEDLADTISDRFSFQGKPFVVDIGSNDGILLRPFQKKGWRVLGVDPARAIAKRAAENGIPTLPVFFSREIARGILEEHGSAHLVTATSAFPHIDDLDEAVSGVKMLLADGGIFLIEAYALADLVQKNLFDTIYHEHLSYFTVRTLSALFDRLGMELFDLKKTDTHGGSLRAFVQKKGGPHEKNPRVDEEIAREEEMKLDRADTFRAFSSSIEKNRIRLEALLSDLKKQGARIFGYGAAAKSTTLLNCFGIGKETLDYIVDDSPWKQGLYTPGTQIPVVAPSELERNPPEYILILAWNFSQSIMKKVSALPGGRNAKFITPVPKPRILPAEAKLPS